MKKLQKLSQEGKFLTFLLQMFADLHFIGQELIFYNFHHFCMLINIFMKKNLLAVNPMDIFLCVGWGQILSHVSNYLCQGIWESNEILLTCIVDKTSDIIFCIWLIHKANDTKVQKKKQVTVYQTNTYVKCSSQNKNMAKNLRQKY